MFCRKLQSHTDFFGSLFDWAIQGGMPNEGQRLCADTQRVLSIPFLPTLANKNRFEKIGTRLIDFLVCYCAEVRNWDLVNWWFF